MKISVNILKGSLRIVIDMVHDNDVRLFPKSIHNQRSGRTNEVILQQFPIFNVNIRICDVIFSAVYFDIARIRDGPIRFSFDLGNGVQLLERVFRAVETGAKPCAVW